MGNFAAFDNSIPVSVKSCEGSVDRGLEFGHLEFSVLVCIQTRHPVMVTRSVCRRRPGRTLPLRKG
jgi:hypothetical protein